MKYRCDRIWGTLDPFVEAGPVLGRKVANKGFLDALLRADPFGGYHFFLPDSVTAGALDDYVRRMHPGLTAKVAIFPRSDLAHQLAAVPYHCFHLSDCLTSQGFLAALRNRVARRIFPITGVTHSLSYVRYGQAFAQHVWTGATARDCIVATSRAGADVVRRELDRLRAVLKGNAPEVQVIPLGVWCEEFASAPGHGLAEIADDKTVFLVLGRVSPYSKMDLLPLLRAFQRLGREGTDLNRLCLVLAGGADEGASLPGVLQGLAANIGLELIVVNAPDDGLKKDLLHRADVVVSLADNPQETFGLTLLEAAAAGKPVIASDYNGYRDLVQHGKTGILVPTMDGGSDDLISLMAPLLYDSTYHLWLAQDVAVDVGLLAQAITHLLDPGVRQMMGREGRMRAGVLFDWSVVVKGYLELWDRLGTMPAPEPGQGGAHPLALDYARIFSGYVSTRLKDDHVLETTQLGWMVYRENEYPVVYAGIEGRVDLGIMRRILVRARRPVAWKDICTAEPGDRTLSTVMWMLKNDYLRLGDVSLR